jgi:protein involved in polysaccharide export with SLBB domain
MKSNFCSADAPIASLLHVCHHCRRAAERHVGASLPAMKITSFLIALSLLASCATKPRFDEEAVTLLPQAPGPPTRLQVGDVVGMQLLIGGKEVPVEAALNREGWLDLPKVGKFYMLGMSGSEAETVLSKACREQGLIPLGKPSRESLWFQVTGEVKSPGRQIYASPITLTRVIESAGGLTAAANRKRLMIHRANGATERYVYERIGNRPADDPEVWPGDTVDVPKRKFVW